MRWVGHVACMRTKRGAYRCWVGKCKEKRPLGRPRRRWEDSSKIDFSTIKELSGDLIDLVQDRDKWLGVVDAIMNLQV